LILHIDDGPKVKTFDSVGKAIRGHLSAAIDTAWIDDAQPFVRVVDAAEIDDGCDQDHDEQGRGHRPAYHACHSSRSFWGDAQSQCGKQNAECTIERQDRFPRADFRIRRITRHPPTGWMQPAWADEPQRGEASSEEPASKCCSS